MSTMNFIKHLALIVFFLCFTVSSAQEYTSKTLEHDGLTREYSIYIPSSYDGATRFPLLFNLHPGNDTVASWQSYSDMRPLAEAHNFILVYPQARPDPNDGNSLNWLPKSDGAFDDVPFVSALIDVIAADYQIDLDRVYACGYSLGGEFSYELACKLNNRIAAIGAGARTMQANPESYCKPVHPTGIITILGTDDYISPYNGLIYLGVEYYLSAEAMHSYWANQNNCEIAPTMSTVSPSVERYTWATASGCIYVEELKVIGGGHDWPGVNGNMTINADEEIWQFVSRYDINGLIECSTASMDDTSKDTFRLYPNPVTSELTIQIDVSNEKEYKIYSTAGEVLLSGNLNFNSNTIDVSSLPSSIYFLKINSHVLKFVRTE